MNGACLDLRLEISNRKEYGTRVSVPNDRNRRDCHSYNCHCAPVDLPIPELVSSQRIEMPYDLLRIKIADLFLHTRRNQLPYRLPNLHLLPVILELFTTLQANHIGFGTSSVVPESPSGRYRKRCLSVRTAEEKIEQNIHT